MSITNLVNIEYKIKYFAAIQDFSSFPGFYLNTPNKIHPQLILIRSYGAACKFVRIRLNLE